MVGRGLFLACLLVAAASTEIFFYESFDEDISGRWTSSSSLNYEGVFVREMAKDTNDFGLAVGEKAKKYAIVKELDSAVTVKGTDIVLQYDARFQNNLECGGAYLKFLMPQEAGWSPADFGDGSPYSIMFGPDKCGSTNKVHFILRQKNPITGEYKEHHLKYPPVLPFGRGSHVYTAVVHSNHTVDILVDGEVKKSAALLGEDDAFDPPLVPPVEIPDPDDKKPSDWDDKEKIPDPDAVKPEDWDEDAPRMIPDENAKKPAGWLDDEPLEVDDPEATRPDDWDEEEDGEWEPAKVPNPKCSAAPGCGEWKPPMVKNPHYKGKWTPPLIQNPNYQGIWKPRNIPNPDHYELDMPQFEPIAAVGVEIWTMNDGIIFDNILITNDPATAEEYRTKTWQPKKALEDTKEKEEKAKEDAEKKKDKKKDKKKRDRSPGDVSGPLKDRIFDALYRVADLELLAPIRPQLTDLLMKIEEHPWSPWAMVGLVFGILFAFIYVFLPSPKKKIAPVTVEQSKKDDITGPDDAAAGAAEGPSTTDESPDPTAANGEEAKEGEGAASAAAGTADGGAAKRRTRREA